MNCCVSNVISQLGFENHDTIPFFFFKNMERLKLFFANSSIHGLHYIVEPKRHWSERVFWIWTCIGAVVGMIHLISQTWYTFNNNTVSFTVETTYLQWETTFPAISICEHESPDKIYESGNKLFGKDRNMNLDLYLRDVTFFDGTCYSCKVHCNKTIQCPENKEFLVTQIRSSCSKLIGACKWNDKPFNCCELFLPINTELGTCYTLNSFQMLKSPDLLFKSNHSTGPGALKLKTFESVELFLHSPEDVPFINHPQEEREVIPWGSLFNMAFQVKEIKNDPLLKDISVTQRNCRFPEETILDTYSVYSYSACIVNCRSNAQMHLCGCVHHFMPTKLRRTVCDIEGLICLTNHSEALQLSRTDNEKALDCDCLSSCNEPEYTIISKAKHLIELYDNEEYGSEILIRMESLPSERYKRNVVRTQQDLIVAIGGAAGLFLGISLLNSFEIIYYLFIRRVDKSELKVKQRMKKNAIRQNVIRNRLIEVVEYSKNQI